MYNSLRRQPGYRNGVAGAHVRQVPAGVHEGTATDFLRRHEAEAGQAAWASEQQRREFAVGLLTRVADERNLMCAIESLTSGDSKAPGPNGTRLETLSRHECWSLARTLSDSILDGTYRHGRVRRVQVPKDSGNGTRPIDLANAEDRLVGRGIVQMLSPLMDPTFSDQSLGFRPRLGRGHALATADLLAAQGNRYVWIAEDIRDAFTQVPRARLLDVLRLRGIAENLCDLIARVIGGEGGRGLPQGGPLSPLLLNLYLDHFLDRVWARRHPGTPLVRVADDLLVLCQPREEAANAYISLKQMLQAAGMPLKGTSEKAIRDLGAGESADWLGLRVSRENVGLIAHIGTKAWDKLGRKLSRSHEKPLAPIRALETLEGWIGQQGPCFMHENRQEVYERLGTLAQEHAYEELLDPGAWEQVWARAYTRYQGLSEVYSYKAASLGAGSARTHRDFGCRTGAGMLPASTPARPGAFYSPPVSMWSAAVSSDGAGSAASAFYIDQPGYGPRLWKAITSGSSTQDFAELLAVVHGLEQFESPRVITLHTRSQLVRDVIDGTRTAQEQQAQLRLPDNRMSTHSAVERLRALAAVHQIRLAAIPLTPAASH